MKKERLNIEVFRALHDKIVENYRSLHAQPEQPEYQLYGYNEEDESKGSIRQAIVNKYKEQDKELPADLRRKGSYNGKYLRDALKVKLRHSDHGFIDLSQAYLETYLFFLDSTFDQFLQSALQEGRISEESFRAQQKLSGTLPEGVVQAESPVAFRCYYYSTVSRSLESFVLRLRGGKAYISESPSGKSYEGSLDAHKAVNYTQSFTLYSHRQENIKVEVRLVFSGREPMGQRWFATGYIAMVSDIEYFSGVLIAENEMANEALRATATRLDEETGRYSGGLKELMEQYEKEITHRKQLGQPFPEGSFFSAKEIARLCTHRENHHESADSAKQAAEWVRQQKIKDYAAFLEGKEIVKPHTNILSYGEFSSQLALQQPAFRKTSYLREHLEGSYIMLTTHREQEEAIGIEQMTVELTAEGQIDCTTPDEGEFQGVFQIIQQRILQAHVSKLDGDSNYHLVFEIPKDIKRRKGKNRVLYGIAGGLSKDMRPRADKIMLCKLEKGTKVEPAFFEAEKDAGVIDRFKTEIPDFERFFSLRAKDNYLQGSNILFSYLLDLPKPTKLRESAGCYEYYRLSIARDAIKKYPFEIRENGQVTLLRDGMEMNGRAFRYHSRMYIFFYGNGPNAIDGCLTMSPVRPKQHTSGLLTSFSQSNEPFCDALFIYRKAKLMAGGEAYQSRRLGPGAPAYRQGQLQSDRFQQALNVLRSNNSTLFLDQHTNALVQNLEQQGQQFFQNRLKLRHAKELIDAYMTEAWEAFDRLLFSLTQEHGVSLSEIEQLIRKKYKRLPDKVITEIINEIKQRAGNQNREESGAYLGSDLL